MSQAGLSSALARKLWNYRNGNKHRIQIGQNFIFHSSHYMQYHQAIRRMFYNETRIEKL